MQGIDTSGNMIRSAPARSSGMPVMNEEPSGQQGAGFHYGAAVIITCYNQAGFIGQAVESALTQETEFPYQVIVGDDASTDESPQILEELERRYPDRLRVIRHPQNLGVLKNRPAIMRAADAPYLAMLDGDDYFTDSTQLQRKYDFLEQHREYIGYFTGGYRLKNGTLGAQTDFEVNDCGYPFGREDSLHNRYPGMPSGFFLRNIYRMDAEEFRKLFRAAGSAGAGPQTDSAPSDRKEAASRAAGPVPAKPELTQDEFLTIMDETRVDVSSKLPIVLGMLGEIYRGDPAPTYIYRDMAGTVSKRRDGLNYYKSRVAMQEMVQELFGVEMEVRDQMENLVWNAFADAARVHFRSSSTEQQQFLYMWNDGYFRRTEICGLVCRRAWKKLIHVR